MLTTSTVPTASAALIDQTAAAELLGLRNPKTLAIWRVRRQGPPYCKLGKSVRYDPAALKAWIIKNTVSNPPDSADIQPGVDITADCPIRPGCPPAPAPPQKSLASSTSRRAMSRASSRPAL